MANSKHDSAMTNDHQMSATPKNYRFILAAIFSAVLFMLTVSGCATAGNNNHTQTQLNALLNECDSELATRGNNGAEIYLPSASRGIGIFFARDKENAYILTLNFHRYSLRIKPLTGIESKNKSYFYEAYGKSHFYNKVIKLTSSCLTMELVFAALDSPHYKPYKNTRFLSFSAHLVPGVVANDGKGEFGENFQLEMPALNATITDVTSANSQKLAFLVFEKTHKMKLLQRMGKHDFDEELRLIDEISEDVCGKLPADDDDCVGQLNGDLDFLERF